MNRRAFIERSLGMMAVLATSACTTAQKIDGADSTEGLKAVPVLPPGGTIAIIAPASPAKGLSTDIVSWLSARGYRTHIYPGVEQELGYLAGSDESRLNDLHEAFANKRFNAIICLRGGYGTPRLLNKIDYQLIRANPKPFVGYSDITALHIAIQRYAGFVTFHGPMMASDLLRSKAEPTESSLFAMISGKVKQGDLLEHPTTHPLNTLYSGRARGKLVGGNLSMICATLGTPYEIQTENSILFIEDVSEPLYKVDRLLTQLRLSGKYKNLRGVLIGDFDKLTLQELTPLLKQEFGPLQIPVLAGWSSGHSDPNLTLPLGAVITMDATKQQIRLEQNVTLRNN